MHKGTTEYPSLLYDNLLIRKDKLFKSNVYCLLSFLWALAEIFLFWGCVY